MKKALIIRPGKPDKYQPDEIVGWTKIGTISIDSETGALVQNVVTKRYGLARYGEIKDLDQRRVAPVVEHSSNAKTIEDGARCQIYLGKAEVNKAKTIGGGNVSKGVRTALDAYKENSGEDTLVE